MIRNLLFDLGGVIMDLRRDNCIASFRRLGMEHPERLLDPYCQRGPFLGVEDGSYTASQFRNEVRRLLPSPVADAEIDDAFQDFLAGIPLLRLRALEALRAQYRIYLISNTNPIMWNGRIASELRKDGHTPDHYFDGIILSYEARSVKPDKTIFLQAIDRFGIRPDETLFFDDSPRNIEAADALGFHGILVEPGKEFTDLIPDSPEP